MLRWIPEQARQMNTPREQEPQPGSAERKMETHKPMETRDGAHFVVTVSMCVCVSTWDCLILRTQIEDVLAGDNRTFLDEITVSYARLVSTCARFLATVTFHNA